jgi:hypothetical protein
MLLNYEKFHTIVACIAVAMQRSLEGTCLITAGKHVNNTQAITRQLLGKRVPAATGTHATVEVLLNSNTGNGVFYVVRAEVL